MKTKFKINESLLINGTYHLYTLRGVTNECIKNIFGELPFGCNHSNKYSEVLILRHEDEDVIEGTGSWDDGQGVYTLYTLYGEWRIGGFETNQHIADLIELIEDFERH